MSSRVSLMKLMYAGYYGGSTIKGVAPQYIVNALSRRFDVATRLIQTRHVSGVLDFEIRCYEPKGRLRLTIRYGWTGAGWRYEPVAVRQSRPQRKPGDVVYRSDGTYSIAA